MPAAPTILLLDNGSLEPRAVLSLRDLSRRLSEHTGKTVCPVSLLHSHKIPAEQLGGRAADSFARFMNARIAAGCCEFLVLPLFFGPSAALTDYLTERVRLLLTKHPDLRVRIAPCLVDSRQEGDLRMAKILEDQIHSLTGHRGQPGERIILVDHGSPKREVTAVRELLATQLRSLLGVDASQVITASMERRPEPEYAFNEPLLEGALESLDASEHVILSMLFISPGRHAGPGGDIVQICEKVRAKNPGMHIRMTPLVGEHPGLIPLLAEKLDGLLAKQSL